MDPRTVSVEPYETPFALYFSLIQRKQISPVIVGPTALQASKANCNFRVRGGFRMVGCRTVTVTNRGQRGGWASESLAIG